MTWISRRPDGEVAAELAESRSDNGALAGMRLAVHGTVDASPAAVLQAAGAVLLGTTGGTAGSTVAVAGGEADIAIATDTAGSEYPPAAPRGVAAITPTVGVIGAAAIAESSSAITIVASSLDLAGRAAAVAAAGSPSRCWPADVRLAAPPMPVVAIPERLPGLVGRSAAAFDAAVRRLSDGECRIVTVDTALLGESSTQPGNPGQIQVRRLREWAAAALAGADALLLPTAPGDPGAAAELCMLLDLCAVAVCTGTADDEQVVVTVLARPFDDAVAADIAARVGDTTPLETVWPLAAAEHAELVVFGAHLLGGPLVHQLTDRGARFAGEITTAPRYRMTALPTTPAKPGVTRVPEGAAGAALTGHRWLLSPAALGRFLAALPAPMQLGKVEFADGSWRTAFGCDGSVQGADISSYGSWTAAVAAGAVRQT